MKIVWHKKAKSVLSIFTALVIIVLFHTFLNSYTCSKQEIILDYLEFNDVSERTIKTDMEHILPVAHKIKFKPLLVTFINDAYLSFLMSWLCNTKDMNIHNQVLIVTSDKNIKNKLTTLWPEVTVVSIVMNHSNGDQIFSHVGYVQLMIRRSQIIYGLLQNGFEIFLFEVDCLWLKNPVNYIQRFSGYDMIVGKITGRPEITGGLMYLYPTENTVRTFRELNRKLTLLGHRIRNKPSDHFVSAQDNEQMYLSGFVRQNFSGLHTKILSPNKFADGMWYCLALSKRRKCYPFLINNNWVIGNKRKIARAKMWGHWFVTEDYRCLTEQVDKVVNGWQNYNYEPMIPSLYSPCEKERKSKYFSLTP